MESTLTAISSKSDKMKNMIPYVGLATFYIFSISLILSLAYRCYQRQGFSIHLLFTLAYFVTFYLGFPFSLALALGFDISVQNVEILFVTLFTATVGYLLYYGVYSVRLLPITKQVGYHNKFTAFQRYSISEAKLTAFFLIGIALSAVGYFFLQNGLLLFKLTQYNQIFSQEVNAVALKRFFYFFLSGLLIFYFLTESKKAWLLFLIFGITFGVLTYILVGGTRANLALAFMLFTLVGIYKRYFSPIWLIFAGIIAIFAMFLLALARYGLEVDGSEALLTFLYLTRDTFSPWENLALLLANKVEYQGLMPIVRDFYVFIPKTLWDLRPDFILNTANYFTFEVLNYYTGLAISPTLLGSLYIMGGYPMIAIGMVWIGIIIKGFDCLLSYAKQHRKKSSSAILKAYCFANLFNIIVLVREGLDAFLSRFLFFSVVFLSCWCLAYFIVLIFAKTGQTRN